MNNGVSPSQNSTTTKPIELPDSEPQALDDDVQIISSQDKCITLDDDSDVIIEENNNPVTIDIDSDDLEIIESNNTPIVIEDENPNCVINPLNIIQKKQDQLFDVVCLENSLLAQVIEDAINLDASGSMKRIIHRTLIPLFLNCNKSYKESDIFKKSLQRTSILLETAPHLKYSHIKSLCESLKYTKIRRKPPRVKQQTQTQAQTSESTPKKRKYKHKKLRRHKKRKKDTTNVDLTKQKKQKESTESTISKENNTSSNTLIEIEIPNVTSISPSSNKENIETDNIETKNERLQNNCNNIASTDTTNNTEIDTNNLLRPLNVVNTQITPPDTAHKTVEASTTNNNDNNNIEIDANNLLKPHYAVNTLITPLDTAEHTIESLEKQIAYLKMKLERIEEQEVIGDNALSPYIIADTIKLKIVKLYKRLCDLTGSECTKRHEVKLQVVNGHPPGPARCLEEYINENIDEYGNPPFPDIFEVVRCVERAVKEDRLNWNRKQIVAEARVLLKHYGHAIQKRRKKREWRDMVSRCKEELVDPADLDPALEAKLLENSKIAKRNEDEIVDRYARIEKENSSNPAFRLSLEAGDSETDSDEDIREPCHYNKPIEHNIGEGPNLTITDSTTNLENVINSTNIQGSPSIINSSTDIVESNIQGVSNVINARNIVGPNQNASGFMDPTTDLTLNLQRCPILIVNPGNNLLPNLHGSICFINSTPVLATRLQRCPSFISSTNNLEGNLQNAPNNLAGNLQIGLNIVNHSTGNLQIRPNFINSSNNLECNQQSGPSIINSSNNSEGNLQSGHNFINSSDNLAGNLQNGPNFINSSNNLEGNLQSGHNFINSSNNLSGNLQNRPNFINSSNNLEGNLQSGHNFINSSNNLSGNLQNRPNFINSSNNSEGNLHNCLIDSTTEIQSTVTNIGNIEYNRTIVMDSTESDTDNERKGHTDIVTYTHTMKERDKSDTEELEYKIKVKQEEDDVIKLLSELGSDCVATVFDIEDPFLVIEISDSSDDED